MEGVFARFILLYKFHLYLDKIDVLKYLKMKNSADLRFAIDFNPFFKHLLLVG